MDSRPIRRAAIALIAAYALALQGLLSAFVTVGPSVLSSPAAALCAHNETDDSGQPAPGDLPCAAVCAALGHAIAGPVPAAVSVALAEPLAIGRLAPNPAWVDPTIAVDGQHVPRGPPLA